MFHLGPKEQSTPPGNAGVETREHHHPKADVRVPVVRMVPVAVGAAHVLMIVPKRAAPQHAVP
jgi:hypothetical protein